jgi:hypothetical protein
MTKRLAQYNIRLDDDLYARLKQFHIDVIVKRNKPVSRHELIIESINEKIARGE